MAKGTPTAEEREKINPDSRFDDIDAADLDAIGVAPGQVRTDLVDFRIMINEMISLWEGNTVTPTNAPNEVVDKIRAM